MRNNHQIQRCNPQVRPFVSLPRRRVKKKCTQKNTTKAKKSKKKINTLTLYFACRLPDDIYYADQKGNYFLVNLCGNVTAPCSRGTSVCQLATDYLYYSCGMLTTQAMSALKDSDPGKGLTVTYTGGASCIGGLTRSATIKLRCLEGEVPGYIYGSDDGDCSHTLLMYSAAACGTKIYGLGACDIILIM